MVRATNDNPVAIEGALIVARVTRAALLRGQDLAGSARRRVRAGGRPAAAGRSAKRSPRRTASSVDIAGHFGRACHVQQGLPVVFHIADRAESYESAIRANVLAGGDSCGRSMALGAVLGARFGFGGERGIPLCPG